MNLFLYPRRALSIALFVALFLGAPCILTAQSISIFQYRHVPQENVAEFVERETEYWSQVAQKAIDDGKMEFWGMFQKMGGYDLPNSSNFLFINTFENVDMAGEVWDPSAVFPDVPGEEMETGSLSTVTSMFFVRPENWVEAENAVEEEDFNYVVMVYHNASDPAQLIALENEHWAPFIKTAMDQDHTTQVAWGNATILSPSGEDIKANTISYDIYPTMHQALDPTWNEDVVFPDEGLSQIMELELHRRGSVVYARVMSLSEDASDESDD